MQNPPSTLIDRFARRVDYVRLSVTDRCDFRCVYCMAEKMTFVPKPQVLTLEEHFQVAQAFTELGVSKIRLTGGEPLIRTDILTLVERLGRLPGLDQLVLTTNGSQLQRMAQQLRDCGVRRINISLDSLQPRRFRQLTRHGNLDQVLAGIETAIACGFERIKINAVILKGRNEDEVLDLVDYAYRRGIDIAFIEEMPLGHIVEHDRPAQLLQQCGAARCHRPALQYACPGRPRRQRWPGPLLQPSRQHHSPGLHFSPQRKLLPPVQPRPGDGRGPPAAVPGQ